MNISNWLFSIMYMLIFTNKMAFGLQFEKLASKHPYKD